MTTAPSIWILPPAICSASVELPSVWRQVSRMRAKPWFRRDESRARAVAEEDGRVLAFGRGVDAAGHDFRAEDQDVPDRRSEACGENEPGERAGAGDGDIERWGFGQA